MSIAAISTQCAWLNVRKDSTYNRLILVSPAVFPRAEPAHPFPYAHNVTITTYYRPSITLASPAVALFLIVPVAHLLRSVQNAHLSLFWLLIILLAYRAATL